MEKKKKEMRNACYDCEYVGNVPGSAHNCCNHPSIKEAKDNPRLGLLAIFASVGRTPPILVNTKKLNIKGNEHGIKSGWFNFPFNFDPVWLENCDGFKKKGK